jgi:hypothetical protein
MKTGIRANDRDGSKRGIDSFQKPGTAARRRTMTRTEMDDVWIGMITDAVPEELVFFVVKSKFIDRVIISQRTLTDGNGEFIKNHIIPILPIERRSVLTMAKANAGNMQLGDVPRDPTESKPEASGRGKTGMTAGVPGMWEQQIAG